MLPALIPLIAAAGKGALIGAGSGALISEATGGDWEDGLKKGALTGAATGGIGSAIGSMVNGGAQAGQAAANASDVASGIETAGNAGSEALKGAGQLSAQTAPASVGNTSMELGDSITSLVDKGGNGGMMNFAKDVGKDVATSTATSLATDALTPDPKTFGGMAAMPDMAPPPLQLGDDDTNAALELMKGHLL